MVLTVVEFGLEYGVNCSGLPSAFIEVLQDFSVSPVNYELP